ncbi:acyltransferase [Mycobacterium sp. ENV421]|uniref:acyltransferase family protein n=1 Tax=Mycobacterium sp. ENV421 TaxID=1213407 RepID=UPI000C9B6F0B|nr:acyltransferase family protein [Mycobacterium sp. ENV421]PND54915.1 acyltransferase [Mycobacterium sp. ENV421]
MHQADSVSASNQQQSGQSAQSRFRADIEGLRAIAVVAVVLFHAEMPGVGGGYVGVDVFFVISGFLITGLLWREANTTGTVRLRSFYGARARRLLPASAAVGIVTMIASAVLLPPLQATTALQDGITSALYVGNYWFVARGGDYFGGHLPQSPFLHYWSLGVEEQFYLVWAPLILLTAWLIRRTHNRTRIAATSSHRPFLVVLVIVSITSFLLSLVVTYVMPAAAFFSLPTRAWQLAVGGVVALTTTQWRRLSPRSASVAGWTGLVLILLACVWFTPTTPFPGVAALLPTLGAALIIGAGCAAPADGCGKLLGLQPMRAIGRISYSWYLWHWPVLILTPALLGHSLSLAGRLTAALLSGLLAWFTLRYLENPLRFAPRIRNSPWRSLGLGAAATVAAVAAGVALTLFVPHPIGRGAPGKTPTFTAGSVPAGADANAYDAVFRQTVAQVHAALAASKDLTAVPANLTPSLADASAELRSLKLNGCMRMPFEGGQPECATGDLSSSTTVAIVGDSHAAMWHPAFRAAAEQQHWRLETLSKSACPLMASPSFTNPMHRLALSIDKCDEWRHEILTRLQAERPKLVVVSMWRGYGASGGGFEGQSGFHSYDSVWLANLTRLVQELRSTGAQVLVLGPVPDPHTDVPICLSGHLDDVAACTPRRSSAVNESGIVAEAAATRAGGGQYADVTDLFCTADLCPVVVGDTLVYPDWTHITSEYSRALAPVIAALAQRALAQ